LIALVSERFRKQSFVGKTATENVHINGVWVQRAFKMILGVESGQAFIICEQLPCFFFFLTVARDHQIALKFTGIRIRLFIKIGEEKDLHALYVTQSHRDVTPCEAFIMTQ
jgi:hypothetical protein